MSQVNFIVYDDATGEILRSGIAPENMVELQIQESNEASKIGFGMPETHYVDLLDEDEIKEKLESPITINTSLSVVVTQILHDGLAYRYLPLGAVFIKANSTELVALDNIPIGSVFYFNDQELGEISDGELRFTTDLPSVTPSESIKNNSVITFDSLTPFVHKIRIEHLHYLNYEVIVYAV